MQKSSIIKNSGIIMFLTIISKVTGFFRDISIASAYGTTYETDAYNISLTIPTLAFALAGAAITTIFIPIFAKLLKEQGKYKMYSFANKILIILFSIILILYLLFLLNIKSIVQIMAPEFNKVTTDLTVKLAKICLINLMFLAVYSIFSSILQVVQEFIPTTLVGIVINVPVIIYILAGNRFGIVGLTAVNVIGYALQVIIQVPYLIKHKYKFKLDFDFHDKIFKHILALLLPVILGTGIEQINTLVDQIIASGLEEGAVSAVILSNKMNLVVYEVYALSIITAIYPVLAGETNKIKEFKNHISKGICNITLVILPSAAGTMVLSRELVKIIFQRGVFEENSVRMTSVSLFYLAIGIVVYGISGIISKGFYSFQDTVTPMKCSTVGVAVNILLDIILSKYMGIGGLSLATSVSIIVSTILIYVSFKKRHGNILERTNIIDLGKIAVSSFIMAVCIYVLKKLIMNSTGIYLLMELIIIVISGSLIYFSVLKVLKTTVFEENLNIIEEKMKLFIDSKRKKNEKKLENIYTFESKNK